MKQTKSLLNEVAVLRRSLFGLLGASVFLLGMPGTLWAEKSGESHSGGDSGHGGGGSGGGEGGGESGGGHGAGRTPSQRAVRHRQRTGRTLGGGETHGGGTSGNHDGGGSGDGEIDQGTGTLPLQDGTTTGPLGGDSGGEHFIHEGLGDWSAGSKVLRGN